MISYPLCHGDKSMVDANVCSECPNSYSCEHTRHDLTASGKIMEFFEVNGVSVVRAAKRARFWIERVKKIESDEE